MGARVVNADVNDADGEALAAEIGKAAVFLRLEHDAIRRNRLIASCSRIKTLERVLIAKPDPLLRNAL